MCCVLRCPTEHQHHQWKLPRGLPRDVHAVYLCKYIIRTVTPHIWEFIHKQWSPHPRMINWNAPPSFLFIIHSLISFVHFDLYWQPPAVGTDNVWLNSNNACSDIIILQANSNHWSFANYLDSADLWEKRDGPKWIRYNLCPTSQFHIRKKKWPRYSSDWQIASSFHAPKLREHTLQVHVNRFRCVNFWCKLVFRKGHGRFSVASMLLWHWRPYVSYLSNLYFPKRWAVLEVVFCHAKAILQLKTLTN